VQIGPLSKGQNWTKNKFNGDITLRELIEICEQIKPHETTDTTHVYLSTYSRNTRQVLINYKKNNRDDYYSQTVDENGTEPDNQIHVSHGMIGLIEVVWCFSEKQREVYGLQNTHHSLIFTRTKSGNLEIIGDDNLEFELNLDQSLLVREKGECVTLEIDQEAIYNSSENSLFDNSM